MKTNGENSTTRLERKGKDSPMQTIVQNSIHSKVFMGCTNRKLSERDEASPDRDYELILPKISRIGKTITSCRNAESSQSHETKQAGSGSSTFAACLTSGSTASVLAKTNLY